MSKLNFESFMTLNEPQKVAVFDEGVGLKYFDNEKNKRIFLQKVIESDLNNYLRKCAVECIALMCFFGESLNYNAAVSVLLDIGDEDEKFVLTAKIKFLSLLIEKFGISDPSIHAEIDRLRFHEDGEVSSQASYTLALNSFLSASFLNSRIEFFEKIHIAETLFKASAHQLENRIDAEFLGSICRLISLTGAPKTKGREACICEINSLIHERRTSFIYQDIPNLELDLYEAVQRIYMIVSENTQEWLNIPASLSDVCHLHYAVVDQELFGIHGATNSKFCSSLNEFILEPFYVQSMVQKIAAVRMVAAQTGEGSKLFDFCNHIVAIVQSGSRVNDLVGIDLMLMLRQAFPEITVNQLKSDFKDYDLEDPVSVATLFCKYETEQRLRNKSYVTGTSVGDEVLTDVLAQLNDVLPDYDFKKMADFRFVLSDIIRYVIIASQQKASGHDYFKFLFSSDAVENDLQQSMFAYIQMNTGFAARYKLEVPEVADGGRVDILYHHDEITIPIELKKTDTKPTLESISENYLAQAQTYTYPYDQLGIFVLLDNSCKGDERNSPINDVRELFNVQHMEPYYKFGGRNSDYIVTIVVPGNKETPSKRSSYK